MIAFEVTNLMTAREKQDCHTPSLCSSVRNDRMLSLRRAAQREEAISLNTIYFPDHFMYTIQYQIIIGS